MKPAREKLVDCLKNNLRLWNRYRALGGKAYLQEANLMYASLQGADLRKADLWGANLRGANLRGANLLRAYLLRANLQGADLDFSAWPLWCGSLNVKTDLRLPRQLAYHLCALDCNDPEFLVVRKNLLEFANKFHRVGIDVNKIEEDK